MPPQVTVSPPSLPSSSSLPSSTIPSTSSSSSSQVSSSQSSPSSSSSSITSSSSSSSSSSSTAPASSTSIPVVSTRFTSRTSTTPANVVTTTSTQYTTSRGPTPTTSIAAGGSTPFMKNTGAVAGVFTLVGLFALGIIIALARNFQRRRRHEAFDRELQAATLQAEATSTGPFFDDDDDGLYKNGPTQSNSYGSGERQLSDNSHGTHGTNGTYSQPPMTVDSYGMREIGHTGLGDMAYPSDPYAAGAAGIGVARGRMRTDGHQAEFSSALKDGNGPYPVFAIPNPAHMPGGGSDPYAGASNMGAHRGSMGYSHPYAQQQYGGPGQYSSGSLDKPRSMDGAGQHSHPNNGYGPSHAVPTNRYSAVNEEMEDAYGGVEAGVDDNNGGNPGDPHMAAPLPNPFDRNLSHDSRSNNGSGHEQVEEPKRVLKVANV